MPEDAHRHRGTRAIQRLVEYAPSSGGLALWVAHRNAGDDHAPLISTDGHTVHYGPGFDALPLPLQTGWVAHEVLHVALRHAPRYVELQQRLGDVDLQLYNTCADAIVNSALSHLAWLELPTQAVRMDRLLATALREQTSEEAALLAWDVERLYRAIDDRHAPPKDGGRARRETGGGGKQASGTGGGPAEGSQGSPRAAPRPDGPRAAAVRALAGQGLADLRPDLTARHLQASPEAQADEVRTWAERIARAHAGDGEHSMMRTLLADLPRTRTPWEQLLRQQLARALTPKPEVSWSRPSRSYLAQQGHRRAGRRLPFEPGVLPTRKVPRVVLVVDLSGSIDEPLLQRFTREIDALMRRLESALTLVLGDDQVRDVQRFEPGACDLSALAVPGGGGTDFTPMLEEAARHDPDLIIVLTDLEGPARLRPRVPVLWAVPDAPAMLRPPFGRLLGLD